MHSMTVLLPSIEDPGIHTGQPVLSTHAADVHCIHSINVCDNDRTRTYMLMMASSEFQSTRCMPACAANSNQRSVPQRCLSRFVGDTHCMINA